MKRAMILSLAMFAMTTSVANATPVPKLYKPLVHMQRVMGMKVAKHAPAYSWYKQVWHGYQNPPHKRQWLCIHKFEGSWSDPNKPYFGGLQMDLSFQKSYGYYLLNSKGTANHWTPLEQMWVAERAHKAGRGFYPWPNTARYCGLI